MNHWIKLPTESEIVLIVDADKPLAERVSEIACYSNGTFYYNGGYDDEPTPMKATHWMPLPSPPQDDGGEL